MHELTTKIYLSRLVMLLAMTLLFIYPARTLSANYNDLSVNLLKDTIKIKEKQIVYDTIFSYEYVYDTLFVYDTIFVDSLPIPFNFTKKETEYLSKPKIAALPKTDSLKVKAIFPPSRWFLSLEAGPFLFENLNTYRNSVSADFQNDFSASLHPIAGWEIGLNLGKMINPNWGFQAGISYSSFHENFRFNRNFVLKDSSFTLHDTTIYTQIFDTVTIYNLDALLQGDSTIYVEFPYTYWGAQHQEDTSWVRNDSIVKDTLSYSSSWSVLEIPLMAIYTLPSKKYPVELMAGMVPSWLLRQDRYFLFPNDPAPIGKLRTETERFTLHFMLAANWNIPVTGQLDITLKPWIKVPLYQYNSNQSITSRQSTQGFSIGIRYHF